MKSKIVTISILCIAILASCEDYRMQNMETDHVFIQRSGASPYAPTITGMSSKALDSVLVYAYKSGYLGLSTTVSYKIGDPLLLDNYNSANGTGYLMLPASCYTIPQKDFMLTKLGELAPFRVEYVPQKLLDAGAPLDQVKFALPIRIFSSNNQVLVVDGKDVIILLFCVSDK